MKYKARSSLYEYTTTRPNARMGKFGKGLQDSLPLGLSMQDSESPLSGALPTLCDWEMRPTLGYLMEGMALKTRGRRTERKAGEERNAEGECEREGQDGVRVGSEVISRQSEYSRLVHTADETTLDRFLCYNTGASNIELKGNRRER
jgi:hypothetical protein